MAKIKISDLHPTGTELFSDSESYMNEINDIERANVLGGIIGPSTDLCGEISFAVASAIISRASGLACTVSVSFFITVAPPAY